ncbi:hypothetical protein B0T25DRAFT_519114 [Lasiosphaeria hispida]|uniref:Uncharacterized protein n=1 Tax=Lasiosphaeria hispida TaxID=260671 RepID=A0AAJ0HDQ3_9PEZI|nr:hypothetical protein B0T25DRAFT_519114 [Lasiosphaeria hispida]
MPPSTFLIARLPRFSSLQHSLSMKGSLSTTALWVFALANLHLTDSALVNPDPQAECKQDVDQQTICPSGGGCCTGGLECCAGGCCSLTAVCVNKGRGDEGCCPIDDVTNCGAVLPTYTLPPCDGAPRSSVTCTINLSDTWSCPPDNACGVRYGACFTLASSCTAADGGVTSTPAPGSSSTGGGGATGTGSAASSATTTASLSGGGSFHGVEARVVAALGALAVVGAIGVFV